MPEKKPVIILIVAMSNNRVIGIKNRLPWSISEDLKHFKELTIGHAIFMGRKTYDSIGRALPGRRNYVISRNEKLKIPDVTVVNSLASGLLMCGREEKIYVIGGQQIYEKALPLTNRIEVTRVNLNINGDAFFPSLDKTKWKVLTSQKLVSKKSNIEFEFQTFLRTKPKEILVREGETH